jgi:hypothetical protein
MPVAGRQEDIAYDLTFLTASAFIVPHTREHPVTASLDPRWKRQ